jgi:hypothetical protein
MPLSPQQMAEIKARANVHVETDANGRIVQQKSKSEWASPFIKENSPYKTITFGDAGQKEYMPIPMFFNAEDVYEQQTFQQGYDASRVVGAKSGKVHNNYSWANSFVATFTSYSNCGGDLVNPYMSKQYGKSVLVPHNMTKSRDGSWFNNTGNFPVLNEWLTRSNPFQEYYSKKTFAGKSVMSWGEIENAYGKYFRKAYQGSQYRVMALVEVVDGQPVGDPMLWLRGGTGVPVQLIGNINESRDPKDPSSLKCLVKSGPNTSNWKVAGGGIAAAIYQDMLQNPGQGIFMPGTFPEMEGEEFNSLITMSGSTTMPYFPYGTISVYIDLNASMGQQYIVTGINRWEKSEFLNKFSRYFEMALDDPWLNHIQFSSEEEVQVAFEGREEDLRVAEEQGGVREVSDTVDRVMQAMINPAETMRQSVASRSVPIAPPPAAQVDSAEDIFRDLGVSNTPAPTGDVDFDADIPF